MTKQPSIALLICGTRRSGKDTLGRLLAELTGFRCTRYAYANQLKADLRPFVMENFGFDSEDCTPEEKEIIRPILISYGCAQRAVDINHWVDIVIRDINLDMQIVDNVNMVPVVTDGRFPNEVTRMREQYGAALKVLNLTRIGAPPPTDEEEKHYRQVADMADLRFNWGAETETEQADRAREVLEWLGVKPVGPSL